MHRSSKPPMMLAKIIMFLLFLHLLSYGSPYEDVDVDDDDDDDDSCRWQ